MSRSHARGDPAIHDIRSRSPSQHCSAVPARHESKDAWGTDGPKKSKTLDLYRYRDRLRTYRILRLTVGEPLFCKSGLSSLLPDFFANNLRSPVNQTGNADTRMDNAKETSMTDKIRASLLSLAVAGTAIFGSTASFAAQANDVVIIIICDDTGCVIIER
ncbi:hypothetical protein [Stenotrophomonas sp.]|uniref:hypothetical protein n=1 Tax=Stenotrophomonas sp. TaxID=69392 RepID=UPI00333EBD30